MSTLKQAWFFDFDGVVVDTSLAKADLFVELLPELAPEQASQVREYCLVEGGVPRREKFVYIFREILNQPLAKDQLNALVDRFTDRVLGRVLKAPFLPGVLPVINSPRTNLHRYIISGTPHAEMSAICIHREISQFFDAICGSPRGKADWIEHWLTEHDLPREHAVMIGDSKTDWQAAKDTGIAFLGVDFHGLEILPDNEVIVPDLNDLETFIAKAQTVNQPEFVS